MPDTEDSMPFVLDTIKILRKELEKKVPLIGFSGAPFTLATYMIEGGSSKNFLNTKKMMFQSRAVFDYLMKKLTMTVISYLSSQIIAGAQAVQIFDSWAGILAPDDYKEFELPYVKKIITSLKKQHPETPVIYFANNCAGIIKEVKKSGADVIGIDWRIDIADAIKRLGKKVAVQGNIDPCALFYRKKRLGRKFRTYY